MKAITKNTTLLPGSQAIIAVFGSAQYREVYVKHGGIDYLVGRAVKTYGKHWSFIPRSEIAASNITGTLHRIYRCVTRLETVALWIDRERQAITNRMMGRDNEHGAMDGNKEAGNNKRA